MERYRLIALCFKTKTADDSNLILCNSRNIHPMETKPFATCAVCGKPCSLENCKTDKFGRPVHDACYLMVLASKRVLLPTTPTPED
jgi:hypothetical protein